MNPSKRCDLVTTSPMNIVSSNVQITGKCYHGITAIIAARLSFWHGVVLNTFRDTTYMGLMVYHSITLH